MNKIFFLKLLIGVMTFLIFLGMGGVVYGLLFYKKTPKILPRTATVAENVWLGLEHGAKINNAVGCGDYICLNVSGNAEPDKIAVINPASKKIEFWIRVGKKPEKESSKP